MPPRTTRKPRTVKAPKSGDELMQMVRNHFPEGWDVTAFAHWSCYCSGSYMSHSWSMETSHKEYGKFETRASSLARLWTKFVNVTSQEINEAVQKFHEPKRIGGPRVDGPVQRQLRLTVD